MATWNKTNNQKTHLHFVLTVQSVYPMDSTAMANALMWDSWKGGRRNWVHHRILPEHSNLSILW